jgi:hypothetical protein
MNAALQAAEKGRIGSESRSLSGLKPHSLQAIMDGLKAVPFKEFVFFRSLFSRCGMLRLEAAHSQLSSVGWPIQALFGLSGRST